jgi:hypothetical protein
MSKVVFLSLSPPHIDTAFLPSHCLVIAPDSHLLHAALAIQARLVLSDSTDDSNGRVTDSSLAAAAMFKVFDVAAAAPLTHPIPGEWEFSAEGDDILGSTEPMHLFVRAMLSHDCKRAETLLLQAMSVRCGRPTAPSVDIGTAWWCSSPSLMCGPNAASPFEKRSKSLSGKSSPNSVPRHRFMCLLSRYSGFIWPSHHYSALLESWARFGSQTSKVKQVRYPTLKCIQSAFL